MVSAEWRTTTIVDLMVSGGTEQPEKIQKKRRETQSQNILTIPLKTNHNNSCVVLYVGEPGSDPSGGVYNNHRTTSGKPYADQVFALQSPPPPSLLPLLPIDLKNRLFGIGARKLPDFSPWSSNGAHRTKINLPRSLRVPFLANPTFI